MSTLGGDVRLVAPPGRRPRFSPDGSRMAYWVGNIGGDPSVPGTSKMYVVEIEYMGPAGHPRQIAADFMAVRYPVWSPDGKALLFWGIRSSKQGIVAGEIGGWRRWTEARRCRRERDAAFRPVGPAAASGIVHDCAGGVGGTDRVLFSALLGDSTNLWQITVVPGRFTSRERLAD